MDYKPLGQTGFSLPEIGLGTWEYQGHTGPLRAGIDHGAAFVDTAEAYGTEEIVGLATRDIRNRVFIATKVWPTHFRYKDLLRAADNSLLRLRTDHIDLYQLHWPNPSVPIAETMAAMERLVELGKVRFIGVCNFSVDDVSRAQACLSTYRIVSNQVGYSLVQRQIEHGLLHRCRAEHITVIAYSPLARGIENIHNKDSRGALKKVAVEIGKTEAQVALNWCISKNGVIAIPKANSIERIVENCHASGWRLSAEQVRMLEASIKSSSRSIAAALRSTVRRVFPRRYPPESIPGNGL